MRTCMRHGGVLEKVKTFTGEDRWVCPKDKCGYKENREGEKV